MAAARGSLLGGTALGGSSSSATAPISDPSSAYPHCAAALDPTSSDPRGQTNGSNSATVEKLRGLYEKSRPPYTSYEHCTSPRTGLQEHELHRLGYPPPMPIVVPKRSLVLADTSGIHYRGRAPPGTVREAKIPRWRLGAVPRELTLPFGVVEMRGIRRTPPAMVKKGWPDRSVAEWKALWSVRNPARRRVGEGRVPVRANSRLPSAKEFRRTAV